VTANLELSETHHAFSSPRISRQEKEPVIIDEPGREISSGFQ
jgi:hypothetical protein